MPRALEGTGARPVPSPAPRSRRRRVVLGATCALLALAASQASCSDERAPEAKRAAPAAAPAAAGLDALRARFGRVLAPGAAVGLDEGDGGSVPRFPEAAVRGIARPARVAFPHDAVAATEIADEGSDVAVRVALEGARSASLAFGDGLVTWRAAGPDGGDVVARPLPIGTEDYVVVSRDDVRALRYRFEASSAAGLRLVGGVLEILDDRGVPRLRVPPPSVVDANGARHPARLEVEGCAVDRDVRAPWTRPVAAKLGGPCTLVVRWGAGLAYPVLVDPAWTTTGSLAFARRAATATDVQGQGVLVAGGFGDAGGGIAEAELYAPDPVGAFTTVGSLATGRGAHTATLLPDGKVLVAGGAKGILSGGLSAPGLEALDDTEIYDPATEAFSAGPKLAAKRVAHVAVALAPSGEVLLAGGTIGPAPLGSADVFDPATSTVSPASPMTRTRAFAAAAPLSGDRALVVGGVDDSQFAQQDGEIFDLSTTSFTALPAGVKMTNARLRASATALADGRVLVAGGDNGTVTFATSDVFDPASNTFSPVLQALSSARTGHTATLLPSGQVLLAGGWDGAAALASVDLFDPATSGFVTPADLPAPRTDAAVAVLDTGRAIVLAGGTAPLGDPAAVALADAYVLERSQGEACASDSECSAGLFCAQNAKGNVCCDQKCNALCQSCLASETGQASDGICGNVAVTLSAGCLSDIAFSIKCGPNGPTATDLTDCKPYSCAGDVCANSCDDNQKCSDSAFCKNGQCFSKKDFGAPCDSGGECKPGLFCVDGVCCTGPCDGACQACDVQGSVGICTTVTGDPHGNRTCPGADQGCATACDGKSPTTCDAHPSDGNPCGDKTCVDGTLTVPTCQGPMCVATTEACAPYKCSSSGQACLSSCTTEDDCGKGLLCDDHVCKASAYCDGDVATKIDPASKQKVTESCAPFACNAGECRTSCTTVADCAEPFVCDTDHTCVEPKTPRLDAFFSCATSPAPQRGSRTALALAAVGLAFAVARRRRR